MAFAKLVVLLPLLIWNVLIIPCLWQLSESRTVAPQWRNDVVLMPANGTNFINISDASVQYNCDATCNDKTCNQHYPNKCQGVKPGRTSEKDKEDEYEYFTCWVGCWCPNAPKDGACYCLCQKEPSSK